MAVVVIYTMVQLVKAMTREVASCGCLPHEGFPAELVRTEYERIRR